MKTATVIIVRWQVCASETECVTNDTQHRYCRVANRPGMAGIVPELTHGVQCPGRGSFCPGNMKIDQICGQMMRLVLCVCLLTTLMKHQK